MNFPENQNLAHQNQKKFDSQNSNNLNLQNIPNYSSTNPQQYDGSMMQNYNLQFHNQNPPITLHNNLNNRPNDINMNQNNQMINNYTNPPNPNNIFPPNYYPLNNSINNNQMTINNAHLKMPIDSSLNDDRNSANLSSSYVIPSPMHATSQTINDLEKMNILNLNQFKNPSFSIFEEIPTNNDNNNDDPIKLTNPENLSLIMMTLPSKKNVLNNLKLKLSLLLNPFLLKNNIPLIQTYNTTRMCRNCSGFLNPYSIIQNTRWICSICKYSRNELHSTDIKRATIDRKYCTFDFPTPKALIFSPPLPLYTIFVIDVTVVAQNSGYLTILLETINKSMSSFDADSRSLISFIFFDYSIKLLAYDCKKDNYFLLTLNQDFKDDEIKFMSMVRLSTQQHGKRIINKLLQCKHLISNTSSHESCLGPTMQFLNDFLKKTGGNVWLFTFNSNTYGDHSLSCKKPNTPIEQPVFPSQHFYHELAYKLHAIKVTLNFIYLGQNYLDVSSLYPLIKVTGGIIKYIPGFSIKDLLTVSQFKSILLEEFAKPIYLSAITYLCLPDELEVEDYYGNFFSFEVSKYYSSTSNDSTSMLFNLQSNRFPFSNSIIQSVTMYYTPKGVYRTRVHTIKFNFDSSLSKCYDSINPLIMTSYLAKQCASNSLVSDMKEVKTQLIETISALFNNFKKLQPSHLHSFGLLSPKSLKFFPAIILSLIKSPLLNFIVCRDYNLKHYCAMEFLQSHHVDIFRYLCPIIFELKLKDNVIDVIELCADIKFLDSVNGHYIMTTKYGIYLIYPNNGKSELINHLKLSMSKIKSKNEKKSNYTNDKFLEFNFSVLPISGLIEIFKNNQETENIHISHLIATLRNRLVLQSCYLITFGDKSTTKLLENLIMGIGGRDLSYFQFITKLSKMVA